MRESIAAVAENRTTVHTLIHLALPILIAVSSPTGAITSADAPGTDDGADVSVEAASTEVDFPSATSYGDPIDPLGGLDVRDLNGDGRLDIVSADDSGIAVLLTGSSEGYRSVRYPTGRNPSAIVIRDMNGDSLLDVVTANEDDGTVSVLTGSGQGVFGPHIDYPAGDGPSSIAVRDLNGDGRLDIAVSGGNAPRWWAPSLRVLLATGSGFTPPTLYPQSNYANRIEVRDVNNDGKLDLASPTPNGVRVLTGNGDGTFVDWTTIPVRGHVDDVAFDDLNRDGRLDLVVTEFGYRSIGVVYGSATGGFSTVTRYPSTFGPTSIAIREMTGDGRPDIVATISIDGIAVFASKSTGGFERERFFPIGGGPSLHLRDMDGDGRLDAVFADYRTSRARIAYQR